jgi:hypothetical protein
MARKSLWEERADVTFMWQLLFWWFRGQSTFRLGLVDPQAQAQCLLAAAFNQGGLLFLCRTHQRRAALVDLAFQQPGEIL